ncbi:hypothetical protein F0L74_15170 [Chitinophaga agrisoli]|uniref:Lipoprotein n=1 Tax=Chitinophaga agrisoli TaxID=2607653 RepID=A0A5B2VVH0_9BACT|nr:hypothetical protein [Chitinophaga agrisoli]KAA2243813.1 hypothetical protein F0L74_15170 [Chitinophaga agrisoli]
MKKHIYIAVTLLLAITACKPQKAIDFKQTIDQQERRALDILVSKGGLDEQKLKCLIKHDFKGALLAVDKEELAFNKIINDITSLPVEGTQQGDALKKAAADYYTALKDLHLYDRQEIEQQALTRDHDEETAKKALDKLIQLGMDKQKMYGSVYKKEAAFQQAMEAFEKANGI